MCNRHQKYILLIIRSKLLLFLLKFIVRDIYYFIANMHIYIYMYMYKYTHIHTILVYSLYFIYISICRWRKSNKIIFLISVIFEFYHFSFFNIFIFFNFNYFILFNIISIIKILVITQWLGFMTQWWWPIIWKIFPRWYHLHVNFVQCIRIIQLTTKPVVTFHSDIIVSLSLLNWFFFSPLYLCPCRVAGKCMIFQHATLFYLVTKSTFKSLK